MNETLIDLQSRLAFQEAGIDELTRTVVRQQQEIDGLQADLKHLAGLLRELNSAFVDPAAAEPPPPHY